MECFSGVAAAVLGGCFVGCFRVRRPAPKVQESQILAVGHKFVVLPDGRKLEYSVSGDPHGVPMYYQHGYMQSCLVPKTWDEMAKKCGIRMIAASMPGFGLSDSYPLGKERSLSEWAADVLAVLQQEQVSKTHFFGLSAGCVHIAALVHDLPPAMVGNVCFSTPTAPDDVPGATDGISSVTLFCKRMMGKPFIGDLLSYLFGKMTSLQRFNAAPDVKAALERMEKEMPDVFQGLIACLDHAFAFTYRGVIDNAGTILKPMPFDLQSLSGFTAAGRAIAVTTADDDTTNPPVMQRWFQSQISGSTMMKFEKGWGHMHAYPPENHERILRFLMTGRDPCPKLEDSLPRGFLLGAAGENMTDGKLMMDSLKA